MDEEYPLQAVLDASKKAVVQGSMDALKVNTKCWAELLSHFLFI